MSSGKSTRSTSSLGRSPSGREALADALAFQEERKQAALHAKKRREEQELSKCTFSPSVDSRSSRLVERGAGSQRPALHTPRERSVGWEPEEEPLVKSASSMCEVSKALVKMSGRSGPIHERLIAYGEDVIVKQESERAEKARREEISLSFKPQINKETDAFVLRRSAAGGGQTAHDRLTHEYSEVFHRSIPHVALCELRFSSAMPADLMVRECNVMGQ